MEVFVKLMDYRLRQQFVKEDTIAHQIQLLVLKIRVQKANTALKDLFTLVFANPGMLIIILQKAYSCKYES